jgi:CrcB protein
MLTDTLWIGLGGFVGANVRYWLGTLIVDRVGSAFPWHTMFINVSGSLLIGLMMAMLLERSMVDSAWRLLLVVGFLGGYTTFSSYTFEALVLIEKGEWGGALLYALGSNVLGLLAAAGGMALVRALVR